MSNRHQSSYLEEIPSNRFEVFNEVTKSRKRVAQLRSLGHAHGYTLARVQEENKLLNRIDFLTAKDEKWTKLDTSNVAFNDGHIDNDDQDYGHKDQDEGHEDQSKTWILKVFLFLESHLLRVFKKHPDSKIEMPHYHNSAKILKALVTPKFFDEKVEGTILGVREDCYSVEHDRFLHRIAYIRGYLILFWMLVISAPPSILKALDITSDSKNLPGS